MAGRVTGLGGVFFRARDPEALAGWYTRHFGIAANGPWAQEPGTAVLGLFGTESDYWAGDRAFMINLRVEALDALVARLEAAGIEVRRDRAWDDPAVGRFARVQDPEGNSVELWEPAA